MFIAQHANTWDPKQLFADLIMFFNNPNKFFLIPIKFVYPKCAFHFLNLKLEYLFEEIYAWVRAHLPEHQLVIEPWEKTVRKKVQKEVY